MKIPKHTLRIGDVATLLGLSPSGVRKLDGKLKPVRDASNLRRYAPDVVARVAERRAANVRATR